MSSRSKPDPTLNYCVVIEHPEAEWGRSRPRREQLGWEAHAAFIDGLANQGVVVLGGPVGDPDYGPALLVVAAGSEDQVRNHFADDPWIDTILTITGIQRWSIWIGVLPGCQENPQSPHRGVGAVISSLTQNMARASAPRGAVWAAATRLASPETSRTKSLPFSQLCFGLRSQLIAAFGWAGMCGPARAPVM